VGKLHHLGNIIRKEGPGNYEASSPFEHCTKFDQNHHIWGLNLENVDVMDRAICKKRTSINIITVADQVSGPVFDILFEQCRPPSGLPSGQSAEADLARSTGRPDQFPSAHRHREAMILAARGNYWSVLFEESC
jgi:hypothetical protein